MPAMTRTRYRIYEEEYPYFLTDTIVAWLPVFAHPKLAEIVAGSWRFLQQERHIDIFGYVIMENHIHWIAAGTELSKQVGLFKSYTARRIIDELDRLGYHTILEVLQYYKLRHKKDQAFQFWQEGSHPEQIQNEDMMWQKLDYIHNNPLRRGYVGDATHWRYSSARNYAGMDGLIDVVTDWR
jgi:putative transposase